MTVESAKLRPHWHYNGAYGTAMRPRRCDHGAHLGDFCVGEHWQFSSPFVQKVFPREWSETGSEVGETGPRAGEPGTRAVEVELEVLGVGEVNAGEVGAEEGEELEVMVEEVEVEEAAAGEASAPIADEAQGERHVDGTDDEETEACEDDARLNDNAAGNGDSNADAEAEAGAGGGAGASSSAAAASFTCHASLESDLRRSEAYAASLLSTCQRYRELYADLQKARRDDSPRYTRDRWPRHPRSD